MSGGPTEVMTERAGILYVVPTPIGNLEDMTLRGLRILREVDFIAAEDTRHTRKLLTHFEIHPKQLFSYHQHNTRGAGEKIRTLLEAGLSGALVSDAGMPGISDPGEELIRELAQVGLRVEVIPGPSAFVTALVGSGLPVQYFAFIGFLPSAKRARKGIWQRYATYEGTLVFYEAPHRLRQTLAELHDALGNRQFVLVKELSKVHETYVRGQLDEHMALAEEITERGEFVVIVDGAKAIEKDQTQNATPQELKMAVEFLVSQGYAKKEAIKEVAKTRSLSRRVVYQAQLEDQ